MQLHSDFMEYEPVKKEAPNAELTEKKVYRVEDVVVLLTSVEKDDDITVANTAVEEAAKFMKNLKAHRVLLYPYAHLSSDLAKPAQALEVMKQMEVHSHELGLETFRAPFGWTKRFTIAVKGHPLAEQSRTITKEGRPQQKIESVRERSVIQESGKSLEEMKAVMFRQSKVDTEVLPPNDHRIIGQQMDLYSFHDAAPGMPFFHNKGMIIINELLGYWKELHKKAGYKEAKTPILLNKQLWEISGHWDKYRENMYFTKIDDDDFALKPMNCPGGILIFKSKAYSYRDLPLRMYELGVVHRHELSGVLSGLFRVRCFTQDDAHIFMREDQIKNEIIGVIQLITGFYKVFGFDYKMELSTRPEKSIGTDEQWNSAEEGLRGALDSLGLEYKLNPGDGAFYGPKIDFHVKDAMGRTWQCGTIQLDMTIPDKFDLNYMGSDAQPHRIVMIHRTLMGSIERFLGILVEHFNGKFPIWLAPVQAKIIPISDKNNEYALKIGAILDNEGLRIEVDTATNTLDYKIREAQLEKIPYMLVVGQKEEQADTLAVRSRDGKVEYGVKTEEFIKRIKEKIAEKSIF
ncbi:threonine--tRNA ligase [Candidatus Bathyarchaeota archaeon]|nr:threonine--tRNA ligase [Candidatus Bathyarchaeota archaeon]